jgi:hypothetical protein
MVAAFSRKGMDKYAKFEPIDRFWAKVLCDLETRCWIWQASTNRGYGVFADEHRITWKAHRWLYAKLVEPVPSHLHLDHLCRTPLCVNPSHLEPVTDAENKRRLKMMNFTCRKGHPHSPENTYIRPDGRRDCRPCRDSWTSNCIPYYRFSRERKKAGK